MAVLDALKTDSSITNETDSIGGFSVWESGIYSVTIEQAYITLSPGKAMALNLNFKTAEGRQLKSQFWMTSGEAKGCKNYYINKRTGKKEYLPGFNQANSLCLLTVGKEIHSLDAEPKTVNIYDPGERKEVPTEVDMIMPLIGKSVIAGVIKQIVDKQMKNPNTGKYEPTGETRTENEIDKFFREKDSLTVPEIRARVTEAAFIHKWEKAWEGRTKDKTKKKTKEVVSNEPKRESGAQAPTTDLFA